MNVKGLPATGRFRISKPAKCYSELRNGDLDQETPLGGDEANWERSLKKDDQSQANARSSWKLDTEHDAT
jgi:hypothetical protein